MTSSGSRYTPLSNSTLFEIKSPASSMEMGTSIRKVFAERKVLWKYLGRNLGTGTRFQGLFEP
jgi:hypothetical protein